MKTYFSKFLGKGTSIPAVPKGSFLLWSWLGAAVAITVIGFISDQAGVPFFMAPFGASCVLVFGLPNSPLAQPRNVVFGHFIAGLVGLMFMELLGVGWMSMGLAVATSITLMQVSRTTHAPAGATPLVVMLGGADWSFLITPILSGSLVIVVVALFSNNISKDRYYPEYW